jgi:hypothetical protein
MHLNLFKLSSKIEYALFKVIELCLILINYLIIRITFANPEKRRFNKFLEIYAENLLKHPEKTMERKSKHL